VDKNSLNIVINTGHVCLRLPDGSFRETACCAMPASWNVLNTSRAECHAGASLVATERTAGRMSYVCYNLVCHTGVYAVAPG